MELRLHQAQLYAILNAQGSSEAKDREMCFERVFGSQDTYLSSLSSFPLSRLLPINANLS